MSGYLSRGLDHLMRPTEPSDRWSIHRFWWFGLSALGLTVAGVMLTGSGQLHT